MDLSSSLFRAPELEISVASIDSSTPALPTRLTLKPGQTASTDGDHSPYNHELLTPPLTNPNLDEPPFRPAETDRTSLSMKRRHALTDRRRQIYNGACASSEDLDRSTPFPAEFSKRMHSPSRSKSVPDFLGLLQMPFAQEEPNKNAALHLGANCRHNTELLSHVSSLSEKRRRWTMPGKAVPTRVLTSTSPARMLPEQGISHVREEGGLVGMVGIVETPAVIILQRAASAKSHRTSLRPEAYTSFPTPTFNRARAGFVTTYFGDGWRRQDSTFVHASIESVSYAPHVHCPPSSSDRASVDHSAGRPSHSTTADLICTEVVLKPFVPLQTNEVQPESEARRYSTKHVSQAGIYEVIWDENVSTGSSSASRRTSGEPARRTGLQGDDFWKRRHSFAMNMLETQLFKGIRQSRKSSIASERRVTTGKASPIRQSVDGKDFYNRLRHHQAGCNAEEEPRNFSCSQAPTMSTQKLTGPNFEVYLTTMTGEETPAQSKDLFPPLYPSHTTLDRTDDLLLVNPWRTSWDNGIAIDLSASAKQADKRLFSPERRGSMIGTSTGMRKSSIQRQRSRRGHKASFAERKRSQPVEDDRRPLLERPKESSTEAVPAGSW